MATGDENLKWFREINPIFVPGQAFSLEVDKVLHHKRSKYQDVLVFKSKAYGNVLVLDNRIQCTERDEFAYQEMLALLPLLAHPHPKRVLIIGGGDGGVLREVVKHPLVEEAVLCEIDQDVIDVSKKFLPTMSTGFSHPKAKVHVGNGFEFLKQHKNAFDVIITDSSDAEGLAECLFQEPFYLLMKEALKPPHGIICCQGEGFWLDLIDIAELMSFKRTLFPSVAYAYATTPTYPSGINGFFLSSIDKNIKLNEPFDEKLADGLDTRFYTADVHRAAFKLPAFVLKAFDEHKDSGLKP